MRLEHGDCAEVMASMESNSVDAIVTDPPYGLAFMGAEWDSFGASTGRESVDERRDKMNEYLGANAVVPAFASSHSHMPKLSEMREFQKRMTPIFAEALRVAKPGAHLLCFGGTRTFHRMACAIEEAGWKVKDCIMWVYGSGFPHGMDVAKAIDKASGAKRPVVGEIKKPDSYGYKGNNTYGGRPDHDGVMEITSPATPESARWEGWNTALKPAWEPIIVAQKPVEDTIAANVLKWGVGAMNIDACRVPTDEKIENHSRSAQAAISKGIYGNSSAQHTHQTNGQKLGRFPANLVHDGSDDVLALFPQSKGQQGNLSGDEPSSTGDNGIYGHYGPRSECIARNDFGSAARFFYCAKASKSDRNFGCEDYLTWEQDQELTLLLEKSNQLLRDMCESGTLKAEDVSLFTESSGSEQTGLSQTEWLFITSTVTRLTTDLKTFNSSQRSNISDSILDAIRTSEESGISLVRLADKLRNLRLDSTKEEMDSAINAVSALFDALCEIRKLARKGNLHPTVKPTALMEWLVRLVCRQGGVVLDPFCGSGSTGVACVREGMDFIGIERDERYVEIARKRIADAEPTQARLFEVHDFIELMGMTHLPDDAEVTR